MSTRATLHQLETLTYSATEGERDVLADVNTKLKEILTSFYRKMPNRGGIVLHLRDHKQAINMRRIVLKAKVTLRCSSLPSGKRKRHMASKNRFGIKADRFCKADLQLESDARKRIPASQTRASEYINNHHGLDKQI